MDTNDRLLRATEELLENRDDSRAAHALVEAHAADIAHVLQQLPLADRERGDKQDRERAPMHHGGTVRLPRPSAETYSGTRQAARPWRLHSSNP